MRALLVAGEAFGPDVVDAARRALPEVELYNLYGPTEFTVHATSSAVGTADDGAVPMGAPVWNACAYVLDSRLRPVPAGVTVSTPSTGTVRSHEAGEEIANAGELRAAARWRSGEVRRSRTSWAPRASTPA